MKHSGKLLVAAAVFMIAGPVSFADNDRAIPVEKLPEKALSYMREYFPDSSVAYAREERDVLEVTYEVVLSDGVKIEFDRKGEWEEVESRYSLLSEKTVPGQLRAYVEKNFPGSEYRKVSRGREGYEVKLVSGLELEFDRYFNFIRIDD